jgi:hypothetical protein
VANVTNDYEKLEQNQKEQPMSLLTLSVLTGFIGGVLWSLIGYVSYLFHFTTISPRVIFDFWAIGDWKNGWIGTTLAIILIGLLAIGAALIYYAMFRKRESMWVGAGYGLLLFLIIFTLLKPMFPSVKPLTELDVNTLITTVCLYILFGIFVGYSISYEHKEQQHETEKRIQH